MSVEEELEIVIKEIENLQERFNNKQISIFCDSASWHFEKRMSELLKQKKILENKLIEGVKKNVGK